MNLKALPLALVALLTAGPIVQAQEAAQPTAAPLNDKAQFVGQAKVAMMDLGKNLKGELKAAMKEGGPTNAIGVCNEIAPELAKKISAKHGLDVKRVSLKNRNEDTGAPNKWETQVLEDFVARKAAGENPDDMAYVEVTDSEYRLMKAIPTGNVCLKCHGSKIKPDVAAKIEALYPQDKATGYKLGDIRGAFVITKTRN